MTDLSVQEGIGLNAVCFLQQSSGRNYILSSAGVICDSVCHNNRIVEINRAKNARYPSGVGCSIVIDFFSTF